MVMEDSNKLHIVVFPWLAFGHLKPFLELSKHLANKGHRISYVSTPRNLDRLPKIPSQLLPLFTLVPLPLPSVANLPPNAEATLDVPFDKIEYLHVAYDGLKEPLARFLEEAAPIDWVVYDFSNYWLPLIADRLGIKKVFFSLINGWGLSAMGPSSNMIKDGDGTWTDPETLTRPLEWIPFPNCVVYRLYEAKETFIRGTQKNASGVSGMFRIGCSISGCDMIAVRSCVEFEAEYLQLLEKLHGKPVLAVGLLPVSVEEKSGGKEEMWQVISGWLDKHRKESVVYVALGSELDLTRDQITNLALGLEHSGFPFLWALGKPAGGCAAELPDGFIERTRERGLVWMTWAPQPKILAHDAIGAFLTHCGWSSIIEGLQFGRSLIMLPFVLDQGLNARKMQEKKLGIEIPRKDEDGSFTSSSVAESLRMLLKGETGKIYRDEAKKMGRIVSNGHIQDKYIDKLEDYLKSHRPKR